MSLPQGWKAQVQLLLPPSWREELRDAAFPVLVEVNGRPGSEAVTDRFKIDWGTYMSSHNDVVYVRLDVRGARGQGKRDLFRRIGGVEVQDQLTVLKHLLKTLKYLDVTRVGVWGWGYGGYVTAMVLGSQENVFKCGVAVNPIADWLYYSELAKKIISLDYVYFCIECCLHCCFPDESPPDLFVQIPRSRSESLALPQRTTKVTWRLTWPNAPGWCPVTVSTFFTV